VLAGPANHHTARDRYEGFGHALAGLGSPLDPELVVRSAFTRDGGYEAMRTLLEAGTGAECVFAVNDVMAVGAIAAARDLGVRVPDDVAVAGFDDIVTLRDITPALTTVRVPLVDVGVMATELALSPESAEPRLVHVGGTVVLRESTPGRG
jgi:LacI family transcriptional regulator